MLQLVIYKCHNKYQLVLEEQVMTGLDIPVWKPTFMADMPVDKPETIRMLGEAYATAHNIPVTWERVNRRAE